MKIKKFPQSCLLVKTQGQIILVDPGAIKFEDSFANEWETANAVLITHKHGDHIKADLLKDFDMPIYSTSEVSKTYPDLKINIVKENDCFKIGNVKIEVVRAVHGYNPRLKGKGEVFENVGYIIDDGKIRLYITSDTICFNNEYKADYVFAPVTGYGLTMTTFETALFAKETGAKKLIISHLDNAAYPRALSEIENILNKQNIEFVIPSIGEEIEI